MANGTPLRDHCRVSITRSSRLGLRTATVMMPSSAAATGVLYKRLRGCRTDSGSAPPCIAPRISHRPNGGSLILLSSIVACFSSYETIGKYGIQLGRECRLTTKITQHYEDVRISILTVRHSQSKSRGPTLLFFPRTGSSGCSYPSLANLLPGRSLPYQSEMFVAYDIVSVSTVG